MRKLGGIAVLAVALLLAGCSGSPSESEQDLNGDQDRAAATPTPTEPGDLTDDYTPDQLFLAIMDRYWQGEGHPDDATLITAGKNVCAQLESGATRESIVVIEGDNTNNGEVVNYAPQAYCPELR
ncbi:DUF732 domain-containing protein [Herbiconiux sp. KACC 21604]|uniref:DUF732 domain-containing protein n=1 Tax=unclassified Herbiconiux TaxID=2618217 RepID=UPI001493043A|nr:DUF732 domain-containing protein [Herbiconiux sp. SALV-R1]QJU54327.1 DUF732 domain-containing protein [Herbiconiux sp. SALV-R1]WPO85397.1 DUF732 domain-containing protein [Herbiconiux sp. KACC 21604]